MVGRATEPKLHRMGIYTIGDLAKSNKALIESQLKNMVQPYGILPMV